MAKQKLTQEMLEAAVRLRESGLVNADIACALGISESTFYRWANQPQTKLHRAFSEALKKAEARHKAALLTSIRDAALGDSRNWTAAAWLLERKYPQEYAKRERIRAAGCDRAAAPNILLGVEPRPVQERLPLDFGDYPSASLPTAIAASTTSSNERPSA